MRLLEVLRGIEVGVPGIGVPDRDCNWSISLHMFAVAKNRNRRDRRFKEALHLSVHPQLFHLIVDPPHILWLIFYKSPASYTRLRCFRDHLTLENHLDQK